jgi:hypothetical protein
MRGGRRSGPHPKRAGTSGCSRVPSEGVSAACAVTVPPKLPLVTAVELYTKDRRLGRAHDWPGLASCNVTANMLLGLSQDRSISITLMSQVALGRAQYGSQASDGSGLLAPTTVLSRPYAALRHLAL